MNKTAIFVSALMLTLYFGTFPHGDSGPLSTMNTSNAKIYYYGWPFAFSSELVEEIPVVINNSELHTRILHFESNTFTPLTPMIFLINWLFFSAVLLVSNELYLMFKKQSHSNVVVNRLKDQSVRT